MTGSKVNGFNYSGYKCNFGRPERSKLGIDCHGENLSIWLLWVKKMSCCCCCCCFHVFNLSWFLSLFSLLISYFIFYWHITWSCDLAKVIISWNIIYLTYPNADCYSFLNFLTNLLASWDQFELLSLVHHIVFPFSMWPEKFWKWKTKQKVHI